MNRPNTCATLVKAINSLFKSRARCGRLVHRRMQSWPPTIVKGSGQDELYQNAKGNLPVLQTADEAIFWANELIARIEESNES